MKIVRDQAKQTKAALKGVVFVMILFLASCTGNNPDISFNTYKDPEERFEFSYPNVWNIIPAEDLHTRNEKFVVGVMRMESPSTAAGVIIQKAPAGKTIDFQYQTFLEKIENDLRSLPQFKKISDRKIERNNISGIEIEYIQKNLDKVFVRQKQLIFVTPEAIYYISGSALVNNYDLYADELEVIFGSFQVTSVPENKF